MVKNKILYITKKRDCIYCILSLYKIEVNKSFT